MGDSTSDDTMVECRVFVGGISWKADEANLKSFFEKFGPVVECKIIMDRTTGCSKGYGFVTFATPEIAATVKSQPSSNLQLMGKTMNVGDAYRKNSSDSRGNGGSGSGRGGGRQYTTSQAYAIPRYGASPAGGFGSPMNYGSPYGGAGYPPAYGYYSMSPDPYQGAGYMAYAPAYGYGYTHYGSPTHGGYTYSPTGSPGGHFAGMPGSPNADRGASGTTAPSEGGEIASSCGGTAPVTPSGLSSTSTSFASEASGSAQDKPTATSTES